MNVFQESCCSILGVLLVLLLQGSCDDPKVEVVHKAVGDSLELIADYPKEDLEVLWIYNEIYTFAEYEKNEFKNIHPELFQGRLKMKKDDISVTVTDLKLQDSGRYSITAEKQTTQYKTKLIELQVHDLIREVKIESSVSWRQSSNTCMIHLRCVASGDPSPSYSWIHHQNRTQGSQLNISLGRAENSTLTCTANNTISTKSTTETVVCTGQSTGGELSEAGFPLKYVLIMVGVGVVVVVIFSATLAACCRWRNKKGPSESEAGITVYEDVNTASPAKKRTESVINGMSIYETVEDTKPSQNLPQTLYDKISYQRHAVSACTSSPYQEVLAPKMLVTVSSAEHK